MHRGCYDAALDEALDLLQGPAQELDESSARYLAERIALLTQDSLLIRHAPAAVASGFCATRLAGGWRGTLGSMALPQAKAMIDRALVEA